MDAEAQPSSSSYKILKFRATELPDQYRNMIYSKMLRSLRFGNEYFKLVEPGIYYEVYNLYIKSLLARPLARVNLAVLSDDHDVVLGWSLIEPGKLHYVHVQKDMRRQGIGQELCKEPFDTITHITLKGVNLWNKHYRYVKFNPFN